MPKDPKRSETKSAGPNAPDSSKLVQPSTAPAVAKPVKAAVQPPVSKSSEPPAQMVSFNRWFASKNHKPHWRAGMVVFTDTTVRRTVADWDRVFENY